MKEINARKLYDILALASHNLNEQREYLNSLNVFPVPDGDTGTNMSATFMEVIRTVSFKEGITTIDDLARGMAKGSLMGARGNSGVILSQILRGFSEGLRDKETIRVLDFVKAFDLSSKSAYKAVVKPREGTILTVIKSVSESALKYKGESDLISFFTFVLSDANKTLSKTMEMLPENKSAGTVDAAGAGLVIILQSFLDVLNGKADTTSFNFNEGTAKNIEFVDKHPNPENITFQYCTEFIIKSGVSEVELVSKLNSLGDSIVVVSMDDITKVHIHTNTPGTAFNIAMEYGDLTKMKIDNMKEQSEDNVVKEEKPKVKQVVITVANGDGIVEMFKSIGVDLVISGGQSMNPSVEAIVLAINEANAENVIILPNNKNIILSAKQASKLVSCNVFVVENKSISEGLVAAISYNAEADFEVNCEEMCEAIKDVISCQITKAVKDSNANGLSIKIGDILGIQNGAIICNSDSYLKVAEKLFEESLSDDTSLITIIYGKDISKDKAELILEELEEKYPEVDIEIFDGGQEVYPFLISIE